MMSIPWAQLFGSVGIGLFVGLVIGTALGAVIVGVLYLGAWRGWWWK